MEVEPHAWMTAFGITEDEDVARLHQEILGTIKASEAQLALGHPHKQKES